jgi:hypothetical protein
MTRHATIDAETGLPTAARLLAALAALAAEPAARRALEVLAVRGENGIDEPSFLAGDGCIARRAGEALSCVAEEYGGRAFRLGFACYAVLLPVDQPPGLAAAAVRARLTPQWGPSAASLVHARVTVPDEAPASRAAVRLAFDRLHARAAWQRDGSRDVLIQLLSEGGGPSAVARRRLIVDRAVAIGRRLGLSTGDLHELARAAELVDVGVLVRTSHATDADPAVRMDPLVAERVLGASPSLACLAPTVRSRHEHFDGTGYPDGLRGEEIPLLARIISVAAASGPELSRDAGTRFDPRLVAVLEEVLREVGASGSAQP